MLSMAHQRSYCGLLGRYFRLRQPSPGDGEIHQHLLNPAGGYTSTTMDLLGPFWIKSVKLKRTHNDAGGVVACLGDTLSATVFHPSLVHAVPR